MAELDSECTDCGSNMVEESEEEVLFFSHEIVVNCSNCGKTTTPANRS